MRLPIAAGVFAFSCVAVAVPAQAVPLVFQLTGSRSATFFLDSNPIPSTSSSSFLGNQIAFDNVAGTYNGVPGIASSISFGTGPILAQLNINGTSLGFTQFAGPDLFTGPVTAPVFSVGSYSLTSIVSGSSTLTISNVVAAAVPEPASWAMMIGGFGVVGGVMRRRTSKVAMQARLA